MYTKEGENSTFVFGKKQKNNYSSSKVGALLCCAAKVYKEGLL